MTNNFQICPTCGGQLFLENDPETGEEFVCFQAGHRFTREKLEEIMSQKKTHEAEQAPAPVPPKPTTGNLRDIKRYYDENKERILADLEEMGIKAMCERWHIGSSVLSGLRRRWGIPSSRPHHFRKPKAVVKSPAPAPPGQPNLGARGPAPGLPQGMPAFSPEWPMETQVKWLEVFRDIYKGMAPKLDGHEKRLKALEAEMVARDATEKKAAENYQERAGF